MPAAHAKIDYPVLMNPYPTINPWDKKFMAVLAYSFLQFRRQPQLVPHCNPSCQLYIFVRQLAVFSERFFCFIKKKFNSGFCYPYLLFGLFVVFFVGHFLKN